MKKKSYIDRILNFLNADYNRETIRDSDFNLFDGLRRIVTYEPGGIIEELVSNYNIEKGSDEYIYLIESWIRNNYGNGDEAIIGDYVILNEMPDDPNPIESGTRGIVTNINTVYGFIEDHLIVRWENGRNINLIKGIDDYDVDINQNNQYIKKYIQSL